MVFSTFYVYTVITYVGLLEATIHLVSPRKKRNVDPVALCTTTEYQVFYKIELHC